MSEQRIIKRYANRKLYDTQHSKYVTLDQIAEMIREGDDVRIIDNKSKEDLTSVTLAQIIFEKEKSEKSFLPLQAMRNIIQHGGDSITQFLDNAKKNVIERLPRKDTESDGVGEADESTHTDASAEALDEVEGAKRRGLHELRELLASSQRTIDEWQRRFDDRIRHVARGISPFASIQQDVAGLQSRIAELEAKIQSLSGDEPSNQIPERVDTRETADT